MNKYMYVCMDIRLKFFNSEERENLDTKHVASNHKKLFWISRVFVV